MASTSEHHDKKKDDDDDDDYPWWMVFFATLGAVAMVATLTTLFAGWGRRPPDVRVTQGAAVESEEFLAAVAGVAGSPLRTGGTVRLLNNGDGFFPVLLDRFKNAQKSINFFVYIWEDGEVSNQVLAVLMERARAGVQVRVLLDGMGAMSAPDEKMEELRKAGAQVATFRPAKLGKLTRFHKRNHRRTIVVDGVVAFTGGEAIGDKWIGDAKTEEQWRDFMFELTGPFALTIQSAFADEWAAVTGEVLVGVPFFPPTPVDATAAPEPMIHTGVASAPSSDDHPLRVFYMQTFSAAKERLYITTPYFVPDESLRRVVGERARAGVDVRILLPDEHTDAKTIRWTSHSYFEDLMASGVRIYEYQPTMMHAKAVVVDGKWTVIGSANMDVRSKELNHENVLGILNPTFGATMEQTFLADLAKSEEIQLEPWRKRGFSKKLLEKISSSFSEQY